MGMTHFNDTHRLHFQKEVGLNGLKSDHETSQFAEVVTSVGQ